MSPRHQHERPHAVVLLRCERRDGRRVHSTSSTCRGRLTLQRRDATSALLDRAGEARGHWMASRRRRDLLLPKLLPAHRLEAILHADVPAALPHADDTCYVAQCYPYTYTDLQRRLQRLQADASIKERNVLGEVLCTTLAGNRCDLLTSPTSPRRRSSTRATYSRPDGSNKRKRCVIPLPASTRARPTLGDGRSARRADCGLGARQPPARRVRLCGDADAQPRRRHQRQLPLLLAGCDMIASGRRRRHVARPSLSEAADA